MMIHECVKRVAEQKYFQTLSNDQEQRIVVFLLQTAKLLECYQLIVL